MNYLKMIKQRKPEKIALIHDGVSYTYGELADRAVELSKDGTVFPEDNISGRKGRSLHIIRRKKILDQLLEFLACGERDLIPMLVCYDAKALPEDTEIPENACMAVTTSGTSGVPKVLFRTYESWADFFPIQNKIFGIGEDSRLFVQGSLAFTGNLNVYMAQFFAGATVVAQNGFSPWKWVQAMEEEEVNAIYLIPSKLMCLPHVMTQKNGRVLSILSGSQSLGREDAEKLKQCFPKARVVLYYGASELSYITYATDKDMTAEKNLIGKPFPGVKVFIQQEEIFVDTPYHAEGISCPYTLSDKGYMDRDGNLYFNGRSDDIVGVYGRKISTFRMENELNRIPEIKESAVMLFVENGRPMLTAFVSLKRDVQLNLLEYAEENRFLGKVAEKKIFLQLKKYLADFEMPDRIIAVREMPKNESGKIEKGRLGKEWEVRA